MIGIYYGIYMYIYQESPAMYNFIMSEAWYMKMILHHMCLKPGRTSRAICGFVRNIFLPGFIYDFLKTEESVPKELRWSPWPHIFWCVFSHAFFEKNNNTTPETWSFSPIFLVFWLVTQPPAPVCYWTFFRLNSEENKWKDLHLKGVKPVSWDLLRPIGRKSLEFSQTMTLHTIF